eukprot:264972-Chlamydomonas_euryale.AAC.4
MVENVSGCLLFLRAGAALRHRPAQPYQGMGREESQEEALGAEPEQLLHGCEVSTFSCKHGLAAAAGGTTQFCWGLGFCMQCGGVLHELEGWVRVESHRCAKEHPDDAVHPQQR